MKSEQNEDFGFDDQQGLYLLIKRQEYDRACDQGYKGTWKDFLAGRTLADDAESRQEADAIIVEGELAEGHLLDDQDRAALMEGEESVGVAQPGEVPSDQHAPAPTGARESIAPLKSLATPPASGASHAVEIPGGPSTADPSQVAARAQRRRRSTWIIGTLVVLVVAFLSWHAFRSFVHPTPASTARTSLSPTVAVDSAPITVISETLPAGLSNQPTANPSLSLPSQPTPSPSLPVPSPTAVPTPGSQGVDLVLAFNPGPGANKQYSNPDAILGDPDGIEKPSYQGILQLGREGSVLVAFTDNVVIDAPGPDFEIYGESVGDDFLLVEVSADGQTWHRFPILPESTGGLDLGDVGLEELVFVRLTDVQPNTPTGAEVDAVVAINSGVARSDLPDLPDAITKRITTLFKGPDSPAEVGTLPANWEVTIPQSNSVNGWIEVQSDDGVTGWCKNSDLVLNISLANSPKATSSPTPTVTDPTEATVQKTPLPTRTPTSTSPRWVLVADSRRDYPGPRQDPLWYYLWSDGRNNFNWQAMEWDDPNWCYRSPNDWGMRICQDIIVSDLRGDVAVQWKARHGGTYRFEWNSDSLRFYQHLSYVGSQAPGTQLAYSATIHDVIDWELFFWVGGGSYHIQVYELQE